MTSANNVVYTPYGASLLKASYQRNMLISNGLTVLLVLSILGTAWLVNALSVTEVVTPPVGGRMISIELIPPPSITRSEPQVRVVTPQRAQARVGIPTPVPDEEMIDENVVIASRQDLAEFGRSSGDIPADGMDIIVDLGDDPIPEITEFVPMEKRPEMIFREQPDYPRLAKLAGTEGLVIIQALVGKDGSVRQALAYVSSGSTMLDEAAVKAAYKNRFTPGIQNGRPISVWVTYSVEFILNE
ncbi:MAG: energy transducer TonB [candidate division Zixibacteria bacterium]|nr:energy transducer TonB [candidate division Zixibacteria bacterium]